MKCELCGHNTINNKNYNEKDFEASAQRLINSTNEQILWTVCDSCINAKLSSLTPKQIKDITLQVLARQQVEDAAAIQVALTRNDEAEFSFEDDDKEEEMMEFVE